MGQVLASVATTASPVRRILASVATTASPVRRMQLLEVAVPDLDGTELYRYYADCASRSGYAAASYRQLFVDCRAVRDRA